VPKAAIKEVRWNASNICSHRTALIAKEIKIAVKSKRNPLSQSFSFFLFVPSSIVPSPYRMLSIKQNFNVKCIFALYFKCYW
ncbi:MAG: hypothetical protein RMK18_12780, partial [Armatimonadota bacterium]|nr:hypothetical protein [Armatimonadota bacterium]